jgi:hypothetical protein
MATLGRCTSCRAWGSAKLASTTIAGTAVRMPAYQRQLTRHRTSRPAQWRNPARPSAAAVTMKAAVTGPR